MMRTVAAVPRTLTDLLALRAAGTPGGVPVIIGGRGGPGTEITCAGLQERAHDVAAFLQRTAGTGDRVLITGQPGLEYLAGFFGSLLAGCLPVPVPPPLDNVTRAHLDAVAADCGPRLTLTSGGCPGPLPPRALNVTDIAAIGPRPARLPCRAAHIPDAAWIQYTAGSAGPPQGAVITHAAALSGLEITLSHVRPQPGTAVASCLPWFLPPGIISGALLPLYAGHTAVITQPGDLTANPARWLGDMTRLGVTAAVLPGMALRLLAGRTTPLQRASFDLSSWRFTAVESGPGDPAGLEAFTEAFTACGLRPGTVRELCWAAEAAGPVAAADGRHIVITADPAHLAAGRVIRAVRGTPLLVWRAASPAVRLDIRRLDGQGSCVPGEIGQVFTQGPHLSPRYWRDPAPRTPPGGVGWADTGQLGTLLPGPDGSLALLGHAADLITIEAGAGRRLYFPFLLERTAAAAAPPVRDRPAAAFSDGNRMIIAAEPRPGADLDRAAAAIRGAVSREHGITPADVVLAEDGGIPVTVTGVPCRKTCLARYRAGQLHHARPRAAAS